MGLATQKTKKLNQSFPGVTLSSTTTANVDSELVKFKVPKGLGYIFRATYNIVLQLKYDGTNEIATGSEVRLWARVPGDDTFKWPISPFYSYLPFNGLSIANQRNTTDFGETTRVTLQIPPEMRIFPIMEDETFIISVKASNAFTVSTGITFEIPIDEVDSETVRPLVKRRFDLMHF